MSKTTTRIYRVDVVAPDQRLGTSRLVRASSPSGALRHVAESTHTVDVASQGDLIELLPKGVKVEDAGGAEDQGELPLPAPAPEA